MCFLRHLILPASTSSDKVELARKLAHDADKLCMISRAIKGNVDIIVEEKVDIEVEGFEVSKL